MSEKISEMVSRVAWAMREASEMTFDMCEPLARVAIAEMREPTEAMVKAGVRHDSEYANDADTVDQWRAMIDEALK